MYKNWPQEFLPPKKSDPAPKYYMKRLPANAQLLQLPGPATSASITPHKSAIEDTAEANHAVHGAPDEASGLKDPRATDQADPDDRQVRFLCQFFSPIIWFKFFLKFTTVNKNSK
jgi:hypothetical protein